MKVLDKLTCTIDTNAHTPLAATMIDIPDVSGTTSHPVIVATVPSSHLVSCCLVPYFDTTVSLSFFNGLAAYNAIVPTMPLFQNYAFVLRLMNSLFPRRPLLAVT